MVRIFWVMQVTCMKVAVKVAAVARLRGIGLDCSYYYDITDHEETNAISCQRSD